jgi:hypothetical protein
MSIFEILTMAVNISAVVRHFFSREWWCAAIVCGTTFIFFIDAVLAHNAVSAAIESILCVLWAWIAWNDWKKRPRGKKKKALAAIGAKSKLVLEKMKRNMPRPRIRIPVPIPQPV